MLLQGGSYWIPYTGTWYNLMDNTTIVVTDVNAPLTIEAGGYQFTEIKQLH
jgi:hypothetical protein